MAYEAWPPGIVFRHQGKDYEYQPHLGVELQGGRKAVVDLVPRGEAPSPGRRAFDALLRRRVEAEGMCAIVMNDAALRGDPRLPHARAVMRSAGWPVGEADEFGCKRLLAGRRAPVSLGELRRMEAGDRLTGTACVLAMRRVLAIDLRESLLDDCVVTVPGRRAA